VQQEQFCAEVFVLADFGTQAKSGNGLVNNTWRVLPEIAPNISAQGGQQLNMEG